MKSILNSTESTVPLSISHVSAGFVAVLVGYTSSVAIIFQAASAAGATSEEISSWLLTLGIGMSLTSIGFSFAYKVPLLTAWSTPGAALLVTSLSGLSLSESIGIFIFSSSLTLIVGLTGWFEKVIDKLPMPLAGAMLAGILLQFGLDLFQALESGFLIVGSMLVAYVVLRHVVPQYSIPLVLCLGISVAAFQDRLPIEALNWEFSTPIWTTPSFNIQSLIGVGIPLFIVTMASQNLPGIAVLKANGYSPKVSPLISWTGVTGIVLGPFGGFSFNLAAITAAICMGKEAGTDPAHRYLAAVSAGGFYFLTGLFGATIVSVFYAFPTEVIIAIAGLALLGTIENSLSISLSDASSREAAILTFLVTLSGVTLLGIGSAFWGIVVGLLVYYVRQRSDKKIEPD